MSVDDLEAASQLQLLTSWDTFAGIKLLILVGMPPRNHLTILWISFIISLSAERLHVGWHSLEMNLIQLLWRIESGFANFTAHDSGVDTAMVVHALE